MKKIWWLCGYIVVSVLIGLIFGGAIAGSPTLFPTLPLQFQAKLESLVFAFCLGCIPALIIFIFILVAKYVYLFVKWIILNLVNRRQKEPLWEDYMGDWQEVEPPKISRGGKKCSHAQQQPNSNGVNSEMRSSKNRVINK